MQFTSMLGKGTEKEKDAVLGVAEVVLWAMRKSGVNERVVRVIMAVYSGLQTSV